MFYDGHIVQYSQNHGLAVWHRFWQHITLLPPCPQCRQPCPHIYCSLGNLCSLQQVHFIVNNLSTANLPNKGGALKDLLPKEFWPWFANYMVVKRAAQVHPPAHATRICCTGCSTAALQPPCWPDNLA